MKYHVILSIMSLVLLAAGLVACKCGAVDLEDKDWVLESYGEQDDTQAVIECSEITAIFDSETHEVSGSAGCNHYFGNYEVDNGQLSITALAYTEMACMEPEGVMEQEQQYLQLLILAESYETEDGELRITCSDGSVLVFRSN